MTSPADNLKSLFLWGAVAGLALALLGGCASAEPLGPPREGQFPGGADHPEGPASAGMGGGAPEGARGGLNTFISPMGEPFRGRRADPYPVVVWFNGADTNHDGQLTEEEFVADAIRFFDVLDANHDGVIDGFEVSDYERVVAPEILPRISGLRAGEGMDERLTFDEHEGQGRSGGRGGRGGRGEAGGERGGVELAGDLQRQGAALFGLLPVPEPVASASEELNGRISRDQWRRAAIRRFQKLLPTGKVAQSTLTLAALPRTPVQSLLDQRRKAEGAAKGARPPRP